MLYTSDFRKMAREALRGKWLRTALILLLAALLGASAGISLMDVDEMEYDMVYMNLGISLETYRDIISISMGVMLVLNLLSIFVGSLVRVGMFRVGAAVMDGEKPRLGMLFPRGIYWKAVGLKLLATLLVSLWSLLLFFPGIIASYRYAMAEYLLMKNPQLSPMEAINQSKQYMQGNKMNLFVLELSFIGWAMLSVLPMTAGIYGGILLMNDAAGMLLFAGIGILISLVGQIFLSAYMHVAQCAFFANLRAPWTVENERAPFAWTEYAEESDKEQEPQQAPSHSVDNEPVAREMFIRYGCSRRRMREDA